MGLPTVSTRLYTSLIVTSGVVVRAVMSLGGHQLRALRGKFSHLTPSRTKPRSWVQLHALWVAEACKFQRIIKQWTNITIKELIHTACAACVEIRTNRLWSSFAGWYNLAAAPDGQIPGKLSHIISKALLSETEPVWTMGIMSQPRGEYVRGGIILGCTRGIMSRGIMSYRIRC